MEIFLLKIRPKECSAIVDKVTLKTISDSKFPPILFPCERYQASYACPLIDGLDLDGYEGDPFEGFKITTEGFHRIASAIGELGLPTILIQEGGYNVDDLGKNVLAFLKGFEDAR